MGRFPTVSVLMPTFEHRDFIAGAIDSLLAQTFPDWELIVVDDGSPDDTIDVVNRFLVDERIRYHKMPHNVGLGAALNEAMKLARGRLIAYLPSDDCYTPHHLSTLVTLLERSPDVHLAYSGLMWGSHLGFVGGGLHWQPSPFGDGIVGHEREVLEGSRASDANSQASPRGEPMVGTPSNPIVMVQVLHRRTPALTPVWPTRVDFDAEDLERRQWLEMARRGARFAYTGEITCRWLLHKNQRHQIIRDGVTRYRAYYGIGRSWLRLERGDGEVFDERARYAGLTSRQSAPLDDQPLHIVVVGALGTNPERILALEKRGHRLTGIWSGEGEGRGPFPFSSMDTLPPSPGWQDALRALRPDVIYALLDETSLVFLDQLAELRLGIPLVFHVGRDPFAALHQGSWAELSRVLCASDGFIAATPEMLEWVDRSLPGALPDQTMILAGEPVKDDWMSDDWAPKLSSRIGGKHTLTLYDEPGVSLADLAGAGISVHVHGRLRSGSTVRVGASGLEQHAAVIPSQWVSKLSVYDAAWVGGAAMAHCSEVLLARPEDLALPAEFGIYAAAGLPLLARQCDGVGAVQRLIRELEIGVLYRDVTDVTRALGDESRLAELTTNMRRVRQQFSFDAKADELVAFLRRVAARGAQVAPRTLRVRAAECVFGSREEPSVSPVVSVLMPTFKQRDFIAGAIESLFRQRFTRWELIIVNDGSPDDTDEIVRSCLADGRVRYFQLPTNTGLGAALNFALEQARGGYIAYLPSDDCYAVDHLQSLVDVLDRDSALDVAYSGLQWGFRNRSENAIRCELTLEGPQMIGREAAVLKSPSRRAPADPRQFEFDMDWQFRDQANPIVMVQVMHRRDPKLSAPWPTRKEVVCEDMERRQWLAMATRGARFGHTGRVTCRWLAHPAQRHLIIADGIHSYRAHYGVGRAWLRFEPALQPELDERVQYSGLDNEPKINPSVASSKPLHILIAGALSWNAERIRAFEERGHRLTGLWVKANGLPWEGRGPFPFSGIDTIPFEDGWEDRVLALKPDVIYGLLNVSALDLLESVLRARLDLPFVFHFKESPFLAISWGQWSTLARLFEESDGQIVGNPETLAWLQCALPGVLRPESTMTLDGDMPKLDWMTDEWAPKLSATVGGVHTVVTGRPLGLEPLAGLVRNQIHVHMYGRFYNVMFSEWTRELSKAGLLHTHDTVVPSRWVAELSQFDAAWLHGFSSQNKGEIRLASPDDLNFPARIGTYAAAGLPLLARDNGPSIGAVQNLIRQHGIGILFEDYDDLGRKLRDRPRVEAVTENMRRKRHLFAFDTHVDALVDFFRLAMSKHDEGKRRALGGS